MLSTIPKPIKKSQSNDIVEFKNRKKVIPGPNVTEFKPKKVYKKNLFFNKNYILKNYSIF